MARNDGLILLAQTLNRNISRKEREKDRQFQLKQLSMQLQIDAARSELETGRLKLQITESKARIKQIKENSKNQRDMNRLNKMGKYLDISNSAGNMYDKIGERRIKQNQLKDLASGQLLGSLIYTTEDEEGNQIPAGFRSPFIQKAYELANKNSPIEITSFASALISEGHDAYDSVFEESGNSDEASVAARMAMTKQAALSAATGMKGMSGAVDVLSGNLNDPDLENRALGMILSHVHEQDGVVRFSDRPINDVVNVQEFMSRLSSDQFAATNVDEHFEDYNRFDRESIRLGKSMNELARLNDLAVTNASLVGAGKAPMSMKQFSREDGAIRKGVPGDSPDEPQVEAGPTPSQQAPSSLPSSDNVAATPPPATTEGVIPSDVDGTQTQPPRVEKSIPESLSRSEDDNFVQSTVRSVGRGLYRGVRGATEPANVIARAAGKVSTSESDVRSAPATPMGGSSFGLRSAAKEARNLRSARTIGTPSESTFSDTQLLFDDPVPLNDTPVYRKVNKDVVERVSQTSDSGAGVSGSGSMALQAVERSLTGRGAIGSRGAYMTDVVSMVREAVKDTANVSEELVSAVIKHESAGRTDAVSPAGAVGLMQLMPGTAEELGVDPTDPQQNINGGVKYLSQMYKMFGNWEDALAAYNWGPGNMRKWIRGGRDMSKMPTETKNYIARIKKTMGGKLG